MAAINEIKIKISLLLDDASRRLSELNNRLGNLGSGENKAKKALDDTEKSAGVLGSTMNRVSSDIKGMLAGAFAVGALVTFTNKLVETVKVAQDLRLRLSGMTQGNEDLAQSEAYLTDLSHKHHKSVQDLTASYSSLLVLEQAGVTNRQQSIQLLEGLSNAGAALGASNTQIAQSVYGLSQALGQGTVQSTEFNQIIEPLTGLGNEIAKAFGAENVAVLRKWISEQKITSEMLVQKMPEALKAYAGAAERSGKTITGNYNDVANAYTEMAKELEKPVATAAINVANVGKEAYGWLKDNGDAVINLLTGIALVMLGKGVSALVAYTSAGVRSIQVEQAHTAALIENEQRSVNARLEKIRLAEAKVADRAETVRLATAEVAATTTATEYDAAVIRLTAALQSQAAANQFLASQNAKLAESQLALTAATNTSGVAMTRFKSLIALLGGEIGLAVIAVYGLVKAGESLLNAEEEANVRAMTLTNSLEIMNDQVKMLSAQQVDIDFSKTTAKIDELKRQLDGLSILDKVQQYFGKGVGHVLNQELEVQEQRATALTSRKLTDTKEFDATKLKPEDRLSELKATEDELNYHAYRIEILKASTGDRSTIDAMISQNQVYMAALKAKHAAIKSVMDDAENTGKTNPKLAEANAKAEEKTIASGFKLKEQLAKDAYEVEIAKAGHNAALKLQIEKDYNVKAYQLTLARLEAEKAAAIKTAEAEGKKDSPDLKATLAKLDNEKLAAQSDFQTQQTKLGISQQEQAQALLEAKQSAQFDLEKSKIELKLEADKTENKTALDNLKREFEQGGNSTAQAHTYQGGGKQDMMLGVLSAFQNAGFSANQAKALAAEVGRENDFNPKNVFGSHADAANGETNTGFFSWQGSRSEALRQSLTKKGLMKDGKIELSQESLNAMAAFAKAEMESGQYKGSSSFLANKNISSEDAANQLGHGYIKWAMGQDVLKSGESFDWKKHDAKRAGYYQQLDALSGSGDAKQLEQQDQARINQYYAKRKELEDAGIAANVKAIQAKLSLLDQEYAAKKDAAKDTPEKLPKIDADYQAEKAKLAQELGQLNSELLSIQKTADAEKQAELVKSKAEAIDFAEKADTELLQIAETDAQQQFDLGNISHETLLEKQRQFEAQRYQIALKALQDRRALLDDGDLSGKAKSLAQETSLTNKHAADLKAINHRMALDSQQTFNGVVAPIKSAFTSNIQGILQGTMTLKQGLHNIFQSIVLSYAQSLAGMAIDTAAHWAWELLGFGTKEAAKTTIKATSETAQAGAVAVGQGAQTAATVAGVAARTAAEEAGAAASQGATASTASTNIASLAAEAAAGAYNALVGIPIVGPVIAPIAAATAFAGVIGFQALVSGLASSAGGEYDVPNDRLNFVHKNETIMPAPIATPMRDFFANGYKKLMNPEMSVAPIREFMAKQGNISYGLPATALQINQPQNTLAMTTAASALALQQSILQNQQKPARFGGGTVVLNAQGGDWVHKDNVAKVLRTKARNFQLAKD